MLLNFFNRSYNNFFEFLKTRYLCGKGGVPDATGAIHHDVSIRLQSPGKILCISRKFAENKKISSEFSN
jgi:hypothetical protein